MASWRRVEVAIAVLFLVPVVGGLAWFTWRQREVRDSLAAHPVKTSGVVLERNFDGRPAAIRYTYRVGNTVYEGRGYVTTPNPVASKLEPGDTIVVFYSRQDPETSAPGRLPGMGESGD
jgi:hypothetical protein